MKKSNTQKLNWVVTKDNQLIMKKSNTQKLNWVVTKDNQLIGQMAKYQLSELRLIAYCLAHYDSRKADNRTIEASVSDLQNIFKMTTKDAYAVVRQAVRAVNRKPLEIETERTEEEWYIFTGFRYYKHEGRFEFKISPEAQPLLLELAGGFTRYRLADVYQFRSASTWKMYELVKRWLTKRKWEVYLDELRSLLGVSGKYPRWSNLNQWILNPSIEEINKKSDISVNYEKIKRGRSVVGVLFKIYPKTEENLEIIDVQTETERFKYALIEAGIHKKTAETYSILAKKTGKTQDVLRELPGIIQRAKLKSPKIPFLKYLLGTIQNVINQDTFSEDEKEIQEKIIEKKRIEMNKEEEKEKRRKMLIEHVPDLKIEEIIENFIDSAKGVKFMYKRLLKKDRLQAFNFIKQQIVFDFFINPEPEKIIQNFANWDTKTLDVLFKKTGDIYIEKALEKKQEKFFD